MTSSAVFNSFNNSLDSVADPTLYNVHEVSLRTTGQCSHDSSTKATHWETNTDAKETVMGTTNTY